MSRVDVVHQAIAAVTAWIEDEGELARVLAAEAIDRDPVAFLDALGGLWLIVGESRLAVSSIVADVALGVAQAETEAEDR